MKAPVRISYVSQAFISNMCKDCVMRFSFKFVLMPASSEFNLILIDYSGPGFDFLEDVSNVLYKRCLLARFVWFIQKRKITVVSVCWH